MPKRPKFFTKKLTFPHRIKTEVSLGDELYTQLKPFRIPLILLQLFIVFGTIGYLVLEDYDLMQAFFQATYTFTNTGFGSMNERHFSTLSIIFTTILMISGAGIVTFSVAFTLSIFNNSNLISLIKEQNMIYNISKLSNHYVICYHNEHTIELSKQFRESQIPFVVVDNTSDFELVARTHKYPYYILGDPYRQTSMLKAHLASAKGIVTFSPNIAENIALIASVRLFEKELNRKPYYVIANANTQEETDKLKKLGCDFVVSASRLLAQRISAMAIRPDMENLLEQFLYKRNTQLDLEEIVVPRYSWLVLRKLKEAHLRDVVNISVVGITQKDGKYINMPKGDTVVTSECKMLVIGASEDIKLTKRLIMRNQKPKEVDYV